MNIQPRIQAVSDDANSTTPDPTMAALLTFLEDVPDLEQNRRRDLRSAVRRICDLVDREPEHIPANITVLRGALRKVSRVQHRMSPKTLANIKANVLAAMKLFQGASDHRPGVQKLSDAWLRQVQLLDDVQLQRGLSRFTRFCSRSGIEPDEVSDETVIAFDLFLRTETFIEKPNELLRRTTTLWNRAVESVPGWSAQKVMVPSFRAPRRTIPLEKLPTSFRTDVEAYLEWLSGKDIFAKTAPPKPCRPATIRLKRDHIIGAASVYISTVEGDCELNSLSDLVQPDSVKAILRSYLARTNDKPTQFHRAMTGALIQIAKHWVESDEADIDALKELRRRLGSDSTGLTDKNRRALLQFEAPENQARLLLLPRKLFEKASRKGAKDVRAAVLAQIGLAIEILLMAPMRMGNLSQLRIDQHVTGYGEELHIVLPGSETKNGEEVVYPLKGESMDLFDLYLRRYRPRLAGEDCVWLFPNIRGSRKVQETLSHQIKKTILDETGLTITPHQFRHLAAKLLLDNQPGNYEGARQLLTHRSLKSTTNFYTELQTKNAAREFDQMLHEKRQKLAETTNAGGR